MFSLSHDCACRILLRKAFRGGYKPSHSARVLRAFYAGGEMVTSPAHGPPLGLVERLRTELSLSATTLAVREVATDGTTKLLLRLGDGSTVESVLMTDFRHDRAAGCISSQVGCAIGCDFCATTKRALNAISPPEKSWNNFWPCDAKRTR